MTKILPKGISVKKLIETYEGLRGGPLATFELLTFHLRQGNIPARAKHMWRSSEVSLRQAWKTEPDREAHSKSRLNKDRDVRTSVWLKSVSWQEDVSLWNIRKGQFFVTVKSDPVERIMIRGLRLHSGAAQRLFDIPKNHKARDQKNDAWRAFWHEIIRLVQNGRTDLGLLDSAEYGSEERLILAVIGSMPPNLLAADVASRLPHQISNNALAEEISALRSAFHRVKRPTVDG